MSEMSQEKVRPDQVNEREINLNQIDWRSASRDPRTGVWTVAAEDNYPKGKFEYRVYFENEWFVVLGWLDIRAIDLEGDHEEKWLDTLNNYLDRRANEH